MVRDIPSEGRSSKTTANCQGDSDSRGLASSGRSFRREEFTQEDPRVYAYSSGDIEALDRIEYERWFGKK